MQVEYIKTHPEEAEAVAKIVKEEMEMNRVFADNAFAIQVKLTIVTSFHVRLAQDFLYFRLDKQQWSNW